MTDSLIGEILEGSITDKTSLAALLRMVKVAAFRLDLPELEDWVNKELNGYEDDDPIPEYRQVKGQVVAKSLYHGWQHVGGDPSILSVLQQRSLGNSIAEFEAMMLEAASSGNTGTFTMFFSPELMQNVLGQSARASEAMGTRFSITAISGILDRVRGKVLDWAIEMEKQGVVGEGMTFSRKEKEDAALATTSITFSGPVGTIAGNFGAGNSSGAITVTGANISEALELALSLQKNVRDLIEAGADVSLIDSVENLAKELALASPDRGKIHGFVDHVKTALAGASGNLIALGAVQAVTQIGALI